MSTISFEETECRLIELSRVVQATRGEVLLFVWMQLIMWNFVYLY